MPTGVSVEVVGTEFLVAFSRQTTQTTVTVLKGTVRVRRAEEAVMVRASEQCVVNPAAPPSSPQAVEVATLAAWATGKPAGPPPASSLIPRPSSLADFEATADAPTKVFSTTQQPCTFTLRLRNRSDEDRPLDLRYQVTDIEGEVVREGQESAVAPARAAWEKPLSISIARNGLYTLLLTVQSGETTLEQSLDFAVEE
jgi:hypothetical protein